MKKIEKLSVEANEALVREGRAGGCDIVQSGNKNW